MVVGYQPYAPVAFTPWKYSWYSFLLEAESTPSTIVRLEGFYVKEKSTDTSWDRTSDLPICSTLTTGLPQSPYFNLMAAKSKETLPKIQNILNTVFFCEERADFKRRVKSSGYYIHWIQLLENSTSKLVLLKEN